MTRSRNRKMQRARFAVQPRAVAAGVPLASAISAILGSTSPVFAQEQASGVLEQVVVTAQKREENLQNVPLSIQVIGEEKLQELHVNGFDDYVKFLPSVSYQTLGPGGARVFMRGVSSGDNGNHSGPLPSVGQYLDEQPVTTIQGALDIHMYDIARVEVLAGPQGTLYGASSQSGTIRVITNKPDPTEFKGGYDLNYNTHDPGDTGYTGEGFLNVPLGDSAAIRLVGWYEKDGGYISNVAGERTFLTSGIVVNNDDLVKKDFNDVETYGGRAALKIDLGDSWTITPTIMGQDQKANGVFAYDPSVGDLKVSHYFPDKSKDSWWQAALTVEGRISNFNLVYAGAYLKRTFTSELDYSDYSFFYDQIQDSYGNYYYGNYFTDNAGDLIQWGQYILGKDKFTKESHELRLSSPQDQRFRFVAGLFYQRTDPRHRATLQDQRFRGCQRGHWLAGHPVAHGAGACRSRLCGVRRSELRFHGETDRNGGHPLLQGEEFSQGLLWVWFRQLLRLLYRRASGGRLSRRPGEPRRLHRSAAGSLRLLGTDQRWSVHESQQGSR